MNLDFNISEFNISGDPIPEKICDKLLLYHILPMQRVRNEMGIWITASLKSGYRSLEWEKSHGRSGNSQHTFKGMGAVDWTCKEFDHYKEDFIKHIIRHTKYNRIAVYNSFIHCDYKITPSQKRELYSSDSKSNWTFLQYV